MAAEAHFKVALCSSPMPWPLSFAVHLWFVVEHDGEVTRFEVWAPIWITDATTVVTNALPPYAGFRSSYFYSIQAPKKVGGVSVLATYQGDGDSVAAALYEVLRNASENYPFSRRYRLWPGPNSNTFIAWVGAQVPQAKLPIPRNAFGSGYSLLQ